MRSEPKSRFHHRMTSNASMRLTQIVFPSTADDLLPIEEMETVMMMNRARWSVGLFVLRIAIVISRASGELSAKILRLWVLSAPKGESSSARQWVIFAIELFNGFPSVHFPRRLLAARFYGDDAAARFFPFSLSAFVCRRFPLPSRSLLIEILPKSW